MSATPVCASARPGRSSSAAAASTSDSGWPWAKRLTARACAAGTPARRSSASAAAGGSGPSASVRSSGPKSALQAAIGGSREAITARAEAGSRGRKVIRSHMSSSGSPWKPSSTRTLPSSASAPAATVSAGTPAARESAARKPASVGSTVRQSMATTGASTAKARSSAVLPEPAIPCTQVTGGGAVEQARTLALPAHHGRGLPLQDRAECGGHESRLYGRYDARSLVLAVRDHARRRAGAA